LELNITAATPCAAALILLPTLSAGVEGGVEGCMPWENQLDNRKNNPTRQTMTAKPSSILKSMVVYLYPQFFSNNWNELLVYQFMIIAFYGNLIRDNQK
jgi:hypothetical protein